MNNISLITKGKSAIIEKTIPIPTLERNEILIEQHALGFNYDDFNVIQGKIKNPNPYGIIGIEAAGKVIACARSTERGFQEGHFVAYATYKPGAFCRFRAVPESYLIPLPEYINYDYGATTLKGIMAYNLLYKIYLIKTNSVVAISGASGGIASLMMQILKSNGIKVIAITSNDEKKNFILSNGASKVINYKKTNLVEQIMEETEGEGVNFFFDCIGKDLQDSIYKCTARRGVVIKYGTITGEAEKWYVDEQKGKIYY